MNSDNTSTKIIAMVSTAIIAVLLTLSLFVIHLSVPAKEVPPSLAKVELVQEEEEEFVEVFEPEATMKVDDSDTESYTPEPVKAPSQPTPASGTDLVDKGKSKPDVPAVVSSKEPSDVKVKTEKPKEAGSTVDKKKQEEEIVKRETTNEVANAFKNAQGKHNSATSSSDEGNSGSNKVATNAQGTKGTGHGTVGGGWIVPKYAAVPSTVTGTVEMSVRIDAAGKVVKVEFVGGTPPAASDAKLRAAIEREIRAHKFSRANYDGAEPATANIKYTFR